MKKIITVLIVVIILGVTAFEVGSYYVSAYNQNVTSNDIESFEGCTKVQDTVYIKQGNITIAKGTINYIHDYYKITFLDGKTIEGKIDFSTEQNYYISVDNFYNDMDNILCQQIDNDDNFSTWVNNILHIK